MFGRVRLLAACLALFLLAGGAHRHGDIGAVLSAQDRAGAPAATAADHDAAGERHLARGELHAALDEYQKALVLRERQPADAALVDTLTRLATVAIRLEDLRRAREYVERASRIQAGDPETPDLARARLLETRSLLERWESRYGEALRDADAAIDIRTRHHAEALNVAALETRGDVQLLMGDVAAAQRTWTAALELGRRTLGEGQPQLAELMRKLGFAAFSVGNLTEARELRERALAIGEATLGPCDRQLTGLLQSAATSRQYAGEYAAARVLLRRARRTMDSCAKTEPRPPDAVATIIYNEADLEGDVGDLAAAERLYEQAIAVWQQGFGPNHPLVAHGLDALAAVVSRRGDHARAMTLYRRALTIRRQALGRVHPQVSWTLANVAETEMTMGRVTDAWRDINDAIGTYRQSGASDEPDHFARMLELRGRLSAARGDLAAARQSVQEALSERERVFGDAHPLTAETRATLAELEFTGGDRRDAVEEALMAERNGRDHLRFTLRYLPERQALLYAGRRTHALDLLVSAAPPAVALDQVVQSRGVLLDEFAARARVDAAASPDARALLAEAQTARERFANLVMRSFTESVDRKLLDSARERKDEAERALAGRSAAARAEVARTAAGLDEVRRALPAGSAMVSFVRYDRLNPGDRVRTAPERLASYGAFVVRADAGGAPIFVPLGAAASVDRAIRAWKLAAGSGSDYRVVGTELRAKVWDPIAAHLRGVGRTFIVPDGLINVINFAALPTTGGRFLVEEPIVLHYLSTERDVLLSAGSDASASALVVGRPAFEQAPPRAVATTTGAAAGPCEQPGLLRFTDLPGTAREAEDVARLWRTQPGADVELLTGTAATERALKREMAGRRVVHLATHGFFLRGGCEGAIATTGTRSVGAVVVAPSTQVVAENPLLLSGLAFAGANRQRSRTADQDDGILTGEEIAGLNLQGTEWAVLSACDTGLGEIRAGEGVFGLRRAFQIAGARTVIMSLWSVDDQATRNWMRALYEARLMQHLDTADAVKQASLAVLKQRRAAGQSTHPFYWAAFVAAGDWR